MAEQNRAADQPSGGSERPVVEASQPASNPVATPDPMDQARQHIERLQQQVRGSSAYVEAGRKLGFSSEEDFRRIAPLVNVIRERKIDPDSIVSLLSPPAKPGENTPEYIDPEMLKTDIMRELSTKMAEQQWTEDIQKEIQSIDSRERINAIIGERVPDKIADILSNAAVMHYMSLRKPFDESHPLKGRLAPAGQSGMSSITEYVKDAYAAMKGAVLHKIGSTKESGASVRTTAGDDSGAGPTKPSSRQPSIRELLDEAAQEITALNGA